MAALRAQLEGLQNSLAAAANTAKTTVHSEVRFYALMHGCCIPGIVLPYFLLHSYWLQAEPPTQHLQIHLAAIVP